MRASILFLAATYAAGAFAAESPRLAVVRPETGKSYLTYGGAPLFAFGPGDEMRMLSGAADVERWAAWQREHGMNLVRAYPVSVPVTAYGAEGLAPFAKQGDKWDVDTFSDAYFAHVGEVARTLEAHGIVLHLQLWQIVFFKGGGNRWDANFINPNNNVNEWTRALSRGRDYIDAPAGSPARAHQQAWVRRVLDAAKGRGNVFIDVINELGNEMGTMDWAVEVTRWIRAWEAENDWRFIVGVDSEHHYTPERFTPHREHFDIIILNELRSVENGRNVIAAFNMPAVSVRSSDGRNQPRDYMFLNPESVGPEHQTRYRTLCYRSIFAGLQSIGAYWKPQVSDADYRDMEHWPVYARALRAFCDTIAPHWPALAPDTDPERVGGAVTPHVHAVTSPDLFAVYLECGSHTWNNPYPASTLRVRSPFASCNAVYFDPRTGKTTPLAHKRDGDALLLELPAFTDDAVVLLHRTQP